jgi:hypothetical protein
LVTSSDADTEETEEVFSLNTPSNLASRHQPEGEEEEPPQKRQKREFKRPQVKDKSKTGRYSKVDGEDYDLATSDKDNEEARVDKLTNSVAIPQLPMRISSPDELSEEEAESWGNQYHLNKSRTTANKKGKKALGNRSKKGKEEDEALQKERHLEEVKRIQKEQQGRLQLDDFDEEQFDSL